MRLGIYTIIDRKTGEPAALHFLQLHRHEAVAVRSFTDIIRDGGSNISRWPADFDLVQLGDLIIDEVQNTTEIQTEVPNRVIVNAQTIVDALKSTEENTNGH